MPEVTEIVEKDSAVESGSDSDGEDNDSIPELEETGEASAATRREENRVGERRRQGKSCRSLGSSRSREFPG